MSIGYRDYVEAADMAGQRHLFRLSFPETVGTPVETDAHYRWKFGGYPAPVPFRASVAEEDGVQVGFYAALPYRYQIDGSVHVAGMVCDVMTHPEWRGRGIFTGIGRHALERFEQAGMSFTTGYPIRPEVLPGHLKVGWKVVHQMPMYVRPVGITSVLPTWLRPIARVVNPVLRGMQFWAGRARTGYRTRRFSREAFLAWLETEDAYELFQTQWLGEQAIGLIKDRAFLAWRTSAPDSTYQVECLMHGAALVGLALVRPTVLRGVATLAVLDFMVLDAHQSASGVLHRAVFESAVAHDRDLVACMISRRWAARYHFAANAYLRTPYVFSLIARRLGSSVCDEQLYDESRWHLGWIDSDDL